MGGSREREREKGRKRAAVTKRKGESKRGGMRERERGGGTPGGKDIPSRVAGTYSCHHEKDFPSRVASTHSCHHEI